MACDRSPGKGEGRRWRPLIRGCHRKVTGDVLSDFFQKSESNSSNRR